ncbi:hypothetical protein CRUP_021517 [Coryphaenoides rupestris]|nr:hypothetical protein CRUP_021517 [Coryphaenoides rupestris]
MSGDGGKQRHHLATVVVVVMVVVVNVVVAAVAARRKNTGLRRQAASHLQHPSGPTEASRLLSVSEARVWSVETDERSLTDEDGGRLSLLFTAAPALRVGWWGGVVVVVVMMGGVVVVVMGGVVSAGNRQSGKSLGKVRPAYFGRFST